MNLTSIFQKPVDRPIEGVIKADDQASLRVEVDEYVLTREIEKRLGVFLSAYNDYQNANGVWISGFFGSGKSHLLKMLAYLLESGSADAKHIIDSFLSKTQDEVLRADIRRAVSIPSKSILFNIDQKADVISKQQVDALIAVFLKVFNDMQGYFGKQPHVAQFERDLDAKKVYATFKAEYERIAGNSWEKGREISMLEAENIALAYATVTGSSADSAMGILDRYSATYTVSIEDFANLVHAYIERQGPKFRLNFFVDEVGQYIAGSVKLMTNLQTVAESLATKCRGQAWVIVTAQEDMSDVVGEMTTQQGNDFTKIQARFKTRMKLTSQDVADVIMKRLLAKNEQGAHLLGGLHDQQANNFRTLFEFTDGAQAYKNYRDREHFINAYPFIPYQFVLFQAAIQNLSVHNAFEGRHSSVGERSMLGVFQQVAMLIGQKEIGQLATFDLMFEGIRSSLKANIQRSILNAEQNLDNALAVRLLKALFLVKYVKEFKATERNLTILVTDRFGQDIGALGREVKEALDVLEQQTYIQRSGTFYEYLTDEEKDIEQEIKSTDIDTATLIDEFAKVVFELVIRENKIRAEDGSTDYAFNRTVDGRPFKKTVHELGIQIISPFHQHAANNPIIQAQSMGRDELYIVIPPDVRLINDLKLYLQTEKYINQNINLAGNDHITILLNSRRFQNQERYLEIEQHARRLLEAATFIINGAPIDVQGADPQTRVVRGFQKLIASTYTNLKMLGGKAYRDQDIALVLQHEDGIFGNDAIEMSEPETEILNHVLLQKNAGVRMTLGVLSDRFQRKPYGWYQAAIVCMVAKLYARGRIEVRKDGTPLEGPALQEGLMRPAVYPNLILAPEETFTPGQVNSLKQFYTAFFDRSPESAEAKDIANETKRGLQEEVLLLGELAGNVHNYPYLKSLDPVLGRLQAVTGKPFNWYLTDFGEDSERLLDDKEDILAPLKSFHHGQQRAIYDQARDFLKLQQANFQSVGYDDALQMKDILEDPACYRGNQMKRVKGLMDGLQATISQGLAEAKAAAQQSLEDLRDRLQADERFGRLDGMQKASLLESFRDIEQRIANQYTVIAVVNEETRRFREDTFSSLIIQMDEWLKPAVSAGEPPPRAVEYVKRNAIPVQFAKLSLDDEADLDAYLDLLREAYQHHIRAGKRIQL